MTSALNRLPPLNGNKLSAPPTKTLGSVDMADGADCSCASVRSKTRGAPRARRARKATSNAAYAQKHNCNLHRQPCQQSLEDISVLSYSKIPLSVVIICKNEEKNIERCLRSVTFANEIILVDSGSTDKTLEIAQKFSNVKIFSTQWRGFVENKKFGIQHASFDWILWIDADEAVTKELAEEWDFVCHKSGNNNQKFSCKNFFHLESIDLENTGAISVPRKTFFLGHWVKHSGWYPDHVVRFFNKNRTHFNEKILHEGLIVNSAYSIGHFSNFLLHYSYSSLVQYFGKMNQYGLAGAQELQRRRKKVFFIQIIINPFWSFIKFYFLKKGFLDGLIGLIICVGAAFSNFIKYSNYFFLKKYGYVEHTSE